MRWCLLFLLVLTTTAVADVTRKHTMSSQFMGASEGTSTEYYTADKQATESTTRWTSGFMKTMTGGKPAESGNIVRLDKQVVWSLNPKDKTYTEMTFQEFRDMLKKGMPQEPGTENEVADSVTEDMYEWTVTRLEPAAPKVINGWNCKNMSVQAKGVNKREASDSVLIVLNTWNSTEVPGTQEIKDFSAQYLKALGLDELALTPGLFQAGMLYQKQLQAVIEASKDAPGEPVQSLTEIRRHELKTKSLGNALKEGAANELMGKLPFGKKKEPKEEKPEWIMKVKFSIASELKESSAAAVDAAKFEIPAGYKLKKK
jgi:hypothetical protein